ncbi:MAG: PAS domain-containing protein [Candidatus Yonathbacteria bacterium]|nr:PAS domain-containing protein [Candidatus Yonathbacteria bacterium]
MEKKELGMENKIPHSTFFFLHSAQMKLRTKAILFFGIVLTSTALMVVFYAQYIVSDIFKKQTLYSFRAIAEQTESAFLVFEEMLKVRALDWTSDSRLQGISEKILNAEKGAPDRARFAKEFTTYVREKKMPFDKTIFIADLLDRDGIVVASTRPERVGKNEAEEETLHKAHHFSNSIASGFGEAFVRSIVFEEDETTEPMIHATARIFAAGDDGQFRPTDGVLLLHFLSADEINNVLNNETDVHTGLESTSIFLASHRTSDIYFVNRNSVMVTPSRFARDIKAKQKVDTLPARECFDRGDEVTAEYDNYQGARVIGASVCFEHDGLVMVVEIQKDEAIAPVTALVRQTVVGSAILFVLGLFIIMSFIRRPLLRIEEIVSSLERVMKGDLSTQATVRARDETGSLATMFNAMVESIRDDQKELQLSKQIIEEKALVLEKDVEEHKKQERFLEESKKATSNLLEESWRLGEKLKSEGNKMQTIISSIGDGLVLVDGGYNVVLANPHALEMLAMSREEIIGKDLREIVKLWRKKKTEVPLAEWPIEEMFLTKSVVTTTLEQEFSLTTARRETQIPIVLSAAPLGGGLTGGVIVIRDVTADRELDDAKSGFISVASHQLRTPLTSIRWYSEMLLSGDVGQLNKAQRDFLEEVHGGAERLYQTVDLLLGISRVESGKIKTEKQSINLSVFTGEIVKELASQVGEKEAALSVVPPAGDPVVVSLDPLTLRQVILNLFSNAIRYTKSKDGVIEITWQKDEEKNEAVYSVRDNGIGIPESVRDRVFSKFFRAENARAVIPDGSGLGLALVKELVGSWSGKVWFETEEGKGTTFFFTVPLV